MNKTFSWDLASIGPIHPLQEGVPRALDLALLVTLPLDMPARMLASGLAPQDAIAHLNRFGITNSVSLLNMMAWLRFSGHDALYTYLLEDTCDDESLLQTPLGKSVSQARQRYRQVFDVLAPLQERYSLKRPTSIMAWDIAVGVTLARLGVTLTWLSSIDALTYLEKSQSLAAARYESWQDFGFAMLAGEYITRGSTVYFERHAQLYEALIQDQEGPWQTWFEPSS